MEEEHVLDFNFWPSFADLMLSLVLILIMIVFLISLALNKNNFNLASVLKEQENMAEMIAQAYNVTKVPMKEKNQFGISTANNGTYDIIITNDATFQNITFSDKILFKSGAADLSDKGKDALTAVGKAIKSKIGSIKEIQIQGHADNVPPDINDKYKSNLELGALRAMEVFNHLKLKVEFDPIAHLMCITSYGEYKPVNRPEDDKNNYDSDRLDIDNNTEQLKEQNRRIELRLIYRH
jgi:flagellar motor protein MotB